LTNTSLEQAHTLLNTLMEQARIGAIVPVRLPAQLEEIALLLAEAKKQADIPIPPPPAADLVDREAVLKEQAGFFGHAVHELRTPMTSIRGYSDMMVNPAMGTLSDMQKQFAEVIRANAKRMETLLQDVSDINKLRAGTLRVTIKIDMFKNIAMMIEKNTRTLAEQLNRTLTFDIPSGLPILNTDGELIAKAFTKLVENALRYTKEGGTVTVRASAKDNTLIVAVEDNGIGMTPEEKAQLGTVYFRSEDEYVRSYKGSGLGVPVAYGIIRLLGGTIEAASEHGKGTTFTITLTGMS